MNPSRQRRARFRAVTTPHKSQSTPHAGLHEPPRRRARTMQRTCGLARTGMTLSEYERWETRFAGADYAFGTAPNAFLASCKSLLPASGRALAIADGEGRNGVWLAQQGLQVLSLDFSPTGQRKAKTLARTHGVAVTFELADVHAWAYPESAFDVVAEIFTQFSSPSERERKWAGMRKALKPGGLLIIQGYTPKQLEYGTGGPKQVESLYTRALLEEAFRGYADMTIVEEEVELNEGSSHDGLSAVINFTARKPHRPQ
jgi:SAM-dependent methyltransferase